MKKNGIARRAGARVAGHDGIGPGNAADISHATRCGFTGVAGVHGALLDRLPPVPDAPARLSPAICGPAWGLSNGSSALQGSWPHPRAGSPPPGSATPACRHPHRSALPSPVRPLGGTPTTGILCRPSAGCRTSSSARTRAWCPKSPMQPVTNGRVRPAGHPCPTALLATPAPSKVATSMICGAAARGAGADQDRDPTAPRSGSARPRSGPAPAGKIRGARITVPRAWWNPCADGGVFPTARPWRVLGQDDRGDAVCQRSPCGSPRSVRWRTCEGLPASWTNAATSAKHRSRF